MRRLLARGPRQYLWVAAFAAARPILLDGLKVGTQATNSAAAIRATSESEARALAEEACRQRYAAAEGYADHNIQLSAVPRSWYWARSREEG